MQKISAVIITHNEENRIRQTLESVKWCDEIVVVDSLSADKTVEICQEYKNCKIFSQAFLGFGAQKKFAVEKATNNWALSLDADEVVTPALKAEITALLSQENIPYSGFYVPITLVFLQKVFNYGAENKMPHLRLFDKTKGNFNTLTVHEGVELIGAIGKLKNQMLHYSYADIHHYFEKFNTYTSLFKKEAVKRNKKAGKLKTIVRLPWEFIRQYFIKLNFLNGYPGFVWAVFSTFYAFVKYAKLYEANQKNR